MNALDLLTQIIGALPTRRDWLDPVLEKAARELIKDGEPLQLITPRTYTTTKPTEPGYYWVRRKEGTGEKTDLQYWRIVRFTVNAKWKLDTVEGPLSIEGWDHFAGPIKPPRREPQPEGEPRLTPSYSRYELEVNEAEAWQLIAPVTMGEEWRNVYLDIERDGDLLRLLDRKNVSFIYRNDCVAKGLVISVISPEEQAEANGGNADEIRWRIDIDVRAFDIYHPANEGLAVHRLRQGMHSVIEDAFAQQWQLQNDPDSMAYNPLLQTLVSGTAQSVKHLTPLLLNNREHVIAATLVQWLGTPVGNGFLAAVNKTANNRLAEYIQCQKDPAWVNPFEHTQAPS